VAAPTIRTPNRSQHRPESGSRFVLGIWAIASGSLRAQLGLADTASLSDWQWTCVYDTQNHKKSELYRRTDCDNNSLRPRRGAELGRNRGNACQWSLCAQLGLVASSSPLQYSPLLLHRRRHSLSLQLLVTVVHTEHYQRWAALSTPRRSARPLGTPKALP
jgi:hypothetical protein